MIPLKYKLIHLQKAFDDNLFDKFTVADFLYVLMAVDIFKAFEMCEN